MPDRYGAYQEVGVRPAQIPRIDQASLREDVQGLQSTSRALDQISNYLFHDLADRAKLEGAEYGAANAPSEKQIQDAITAGENPKNLLQTNGTIFGRAARQQQLAGIGIEVESNARQALMDLRAKAKQYEISPQEFLSGYTLPDGTKVGGASDVMDGFASSLAAISPILSRKFRAELGVASNAAYLETVNDTITREKARRETVAQVALEGLMPQVRTIVGAGDTVDAEGNIVTVERKMDILRDRVRQIGLAANKPEMVKDGLKRLDEAITGARQNVVRGWFSGEQDAYKAHRRLDAGDLPPAVASAYKNLTPDKQLELRDEARKLSNARFEDADKVDAALRRNRTKIGDTLFADYADALRAGDQPKAEATMRTLRTVDPDRYATLVDRLPAAGVVDQPDVRIVADRLFAEEKLTRGWLEANANKLSPKTISDFIGKMETKNDARFREADAYIKRELAYPDRAIVNPSAADRRAIQIYNRTVNDLADAMRANPDLDVFGWVKQQTLAARVAGEQQRALQDAQRTIRTFTDSNPTLKTRAAIEAELGRINTGTRSRYNRDQLQGILDAMNEAGQ
jgi:hypothetical protein